MNGEGKNKDKTQIAIQVVNKIGEAIHEGVREIVPGKEPYGNPNEISDRQWRFMFRWALVGLYCLVMFKLLASSFSDGGPRPYAPEIPFVTDGGCTVEPSPSPLSRSEAFRLRPDPK
jgi:hypothetical protein